LVFGVEHDDQLVQVSNFRLFIIEGICDPKVMSSVDEKKREAESDDEKGVGDCD